MKASTVIKPLAFAIAAAVAVSAQAGGPNDKYKPDPYATKDAGAAAVTVTTQSINQGTVVNQGTRNTARLGSSVNDSAGSGGSNDNLLGKSHDHDPNPPSDDGGNNVADGAAGNIGVNIAAGDVNQQSNSAALSTADESFVFGTALAVTYTDQSGPNASVVNHGTQNNATVRDSLNNTSGNIGVNITSGNYNQQANSLAAAVSGGRVAVAAAITGQESSSNNVLNLATAKYKEQTTYGGFVAWGGYSGGGEITNKDQKPSGPHFTTDTQKPKGPDATFTESGDIWLAGFYTGNKWVPNGYKDVVRNNAIMVDSLTGASGNIGVNISAGTNNQQSNSLAIAAGCKACM